LKNVQFCSGSRKAKILIAGIYGIFRGLKFEPDTKIGQIRAAFERGCFSKVSYYRIAGTPSSFRASPDDIIIRVLDVTGFQ
jgi:hypothetical protein